VPLTAREDRLLHVSMTFRDNLVKMKKVVDVKCASEATHSTEK